MEKWNPNKKLILTPIAFLSLHLSFSAPYRHRASSLMWVWKLERRLWKYKNKVKYIAIRTQRWSEWERERKIDGKKTLLYYMNEPWPRQSFRSSKYSLSSDYVLRSTLFLIKWQYAKKVFYFLFFSVTDDFAININVHSSLQPRTKVWLIFIFTCSSLIQRRAFP